jgi:aspartyl protease family protein
MKGTGWLLLAIAGTAIIALLVWLVGARPGALSAENDQIRLVSLVLILVLVGSGLLSRWRQLPVLIWLRDGAIWAAIGFVLIAGYSLRGEFSSLFDRMAAEIVPGRGIEKIPGTVIVRAGQDGHFRADIVVDGAMLHMLVDTGATAVVLSREDAQRAGFDLTQLRFTARVSTANGVGLAAPVRLREVRVRSIVVRDVVALVNKAPMSGSLLGLSFLNRLSSYGVQGDILTLKR